MGVAHSLSPPPWSDLNGSSCELNHISECDGETCKLLCIGHATGTVYSLLTAWFCSNWLSKHPCMTLSLNRSYHTGTIQSHMKWVCCRKTLEMIFFVTSNMWVQSLCSCGSWKIARVVWAVDANLRGLIMTPYYSLQELPSFAHHITCMAWHGNRRCMSFLTQLGTYWLQGKLLHESLAAVPACF